MQALLKQLQPTPDIETSVNPAGTVSVTVTVPAVAPAVGLLLTAIEYVAPFYPARKLPMWVLEMPREEGREMDRVRFLVTPADPST